MEKKKEFKYRGETLEELNKLEVREFAEFLPSRRKRYVLRNFDIIERFIKKVRACKKKGKKIRTHSRDMIIVPQLVGATINVYNGKEFKQVRVNERMLGHKLGEFVTTRQDVKHGAPGIGATRSSAALSVK
jgi:small subunit ribosomal protein S19